MFLRFCWSLLLFSLFGRLSFSHEFVGVVYILFLEVTHWQVWRITSTNFELYFYSLNGVFWWSRVLSLKPNLSSASLFIVGPVRVLFMKQWPVPGSQGCSFFFSKSFIVFPFTLDLQSIWNCVCLWYKMGAKEHFLKYIWITNWPSIAYWKDRFFPTEL